MKDVQCYEIFGGIVLKNHAFSFCVWCRYKSSDAISVRIKVCFYKSVRKVSVLKLTENFTFHGINNPIIEYQTGIFMYKAFYMKLPRNLPKTVFIKET